MEEIGLFPLGMVLLPSELVPLHIFEPRYRELIGECLDEGRTFGLLLADAEAGTRDVGTRARVTEVLERFEDGRLNVVVEGGERFRVVELTAGRSFRTALVESVDDDDEPVDDALRARALRLFERLVELTGTEVDAPDDTHPQLSFAVAARFELGPELKQELLQETSETSRLRRLCEILEGAAETVERQREIAARAQGNGRVHPPGS
jgi:Lon protease-like protein